VILGATHTEQLQGALNAHDFEWPRELEQRLDAVGKPAPVFPRGFVDTLLPRMQACALPRAAVGPRRQLALEGKAVLATVDSNPFAADVARQV